MGSVRRLIAKMDNAFVRSPRDVLEHFNVTQDAGLSSGKVEASRQKYGKNGKDRASVEQGEDRTDTI